MELQFEKQICRCMAPVVREVQNQEVTQEVRLPDALPDVGRVLTTWAQVVLRGKEWRGDTAAVSGGVMAWTLYAPEDGTAPRCVESWIPFNLKWDVSGARREGVILVSPLLRFADARALSARKLMVRAGVAMLGQILCPEELKICAAGEVPEDVQLLKDTYPLWLPVEAGEKTFQLDEELALPASADLEKIISFSLQPEVTEQRVSAGKLVLRGNGNLHLVYRCGGGKLHTRDFELPFSQLQELQEELPEEVRADCAMAVTGLELDPGEEGRLRLKGGLVCQYVIQGCRRTELVRDAYSPRRSLELTVEEPVFPAVLEQRSEQITAQQDLPGKSGQLIDLCFLPDFPRQRRTGEGITLELPGVFQALYEEPDGTLQSATARWEGQYSLSAGENACVSANAMPQGRGVAAAGAEAMELRSQLKLGVETTARQGLPMVTGVTLGELQEPDPARPSLVLCRPEGESLWELAKRWGSTVAAIRQANSLEDTIPDDLLLIPVS